MLAITHIHFILLLAAEAADIKGCIAALTFIIMLAITHIHFILLLSAEAADIKGCIAALTFIINSAAKYAVDEESLSNELQQLGLPKGNKISFEEVL